MNSLIRQSILNPVAGNLFLALLIVAGIIAYGWIPRETFPEFTLDQISIRMVYRGATPDEISESITTKIEEKIASLDGIKEIRSSSMEGSAQINVELHNNSDIRKIKDEIEREVNSILTFPTEAEKPIIAEVIRKMPIISLGLYGAVGLDTLKTEAEKIRDELLSLPDFSQVEVQGIKEREISVEISESSLKAYNLSFSAVTQAIRENSLNLAGGTIRSNQGEIIVRVMDQKYTGAELEQIPLITDPDGTWIRLGDVAVIRDSFEDRKVTSRFNNKLAAVIQIDKTESQDTIALAEIIHKYVEKKKKELPQSLELIVWNDSSKLVRDRLNLLTGNGLQGLFLVVLFLGVFLEVRLAFFVAIGIPVCFLGTFILMKLFGHSLNMLSMFAFIMVLGMVVDDAMVIGEAFFQRLRQGDDPKEAAVNATTTMFWPVLASVATTCVAFLPFYGVEGTMGKFFAVTPFVIISTLFFSLIESYFILPAHLAHHAKLTRGNNPLSRFQKKVHAFMDWHCDHVLKAAVAFVIRYRYAAIAASIALLIVSAGFIAGGLVKFVFFPRIDEDFLMVELEFPTGTDFAFTEKMTEYLQTKLIETQTEMEKTKKPNQVFPFVKNVYSNIGAGDSGKATLRVELVPSEERNIYYTEIFKVWREHVGTIPEATKVLFGSQSRGPGGKPVEIQLLGLNIEDLAKASLAVRESMKTYPFLKDIADNFAVGKLEARLKLKPYAQTIGLSLSDVSNQLRQTYFGDQAIRIQRGKDDIRVYVRYPKNQRETLDSLTEINIRTATGQEIPFAAVAEFEYARGYTTVNHAKRFKEITITADIDEKLGNAREFQADFLVNFLPDLQVKFPTVQFLFRGQAEETQRSMGTLIAGFCMALLGIYAILATIFYSYLQPLIIMAAIPFGFIGAMFGHLLMRFDITMMSMFGLVALAGIVVNNSLVLLDLINLLIRSGTPILDAILEGCARRFMPIFLTSCTTFLGITPMLLERSVQALFLQPMVVALSFGLLVSTFFTLLVVPAIYMTVYDLYSSIMSFYRGVPISAESLIRHSEELNANPIASMLEAK